jgi:transcriptional regulator with XRE-family HTH domain
MDLKKKLSQLRKEKGLTQLELAEALQVSRQAVSRWEVGTAVPTLDNLVSLSEVYGVPLDDLIQNETTVPAAQMEEKAPEGEIQEEKPPPSPLPVRVFKPRTALASLLLAVLLVGVGVLIGLNLPRKEKLDLGEQVMIKDLPPAQLERTPTDIEDELNWLETTVKGLLEEEPSP